MALPATVACETRPASLTSKRRRAELDDCASDSDAKRALSVASWAKHSNEPRAGGDAQLGQDAASSCEHALGDGHVSADDADNTAGDNSDNDTAEDDDEEDDSDSDTITLINHVIDQIELDPYIHEGSADLSCNEALALRLKMQQIGLEQLVRDSLETNGPPLKHIGIALGLPPDIYGHDTALLRILGGAIARAYLKRRKLPHLNTIDDAVALLKTCRHLLVITGAGISTSLGIPDFRSQGTGFYERIRQMGYIDPQDVFDIHSFDENPQTFYSLAGDILPDMKRFSPTHAFIRLLQDQNRLQTNYTQNIDNLESLAGIHADKLVQCHGSFATASCRRCSSVVAGTEIFDNIRAKQVAYCKACIKRLESEKPRKRVKSSRAVSDSDEDDDIPQPGVMKPDITFFGEALSRNFFERFTNQDVHEADLVLVIGTSLKVAPVSDIPDHLPHAVPHIFVSREPIKHIDFDIQLLGNCDDIVVELCRRAGWALHHDMIPENFAVDVQPHEWGSHYWNITPKGSTSPAHPATTGIANNVDRRLEEEEKRSSSPS